LNILLIGNYLSSQGYNQNVSQDLANHLRDAGYGAHTTSSKKNKILRLLEMLFTIWQQRKYYQIAQVDVFSGQAFVWAYLSTRFLKLIHKPVVLSLHGGNLPNFAQKFSKYVKRLFFLADAVTVPSEYLLGSMKPYRNDLVLIPNALNKNNYHFIQRVSARPVLIWLRAFHQIYNPELAIRVISHLQKETQNIRLIMVGPDKGDGSFQRTIQLTSRLELDRNVELSGAVPKAEVSNWLNKGDIFINTTNYDNTPISIMEAMFQGLCIVSTHVGGIPYLLTDNEDALLVPPNDPAAMAAAVKRLLTEPGLAQKLSFNAHKKAEQFDWSVVLPQWEKLFAELA
jgi:glycosyltransferase involved in cell wall biosynthesis